MDAQLAEYPVAPAPAATAKELASGAIFVTMRHAAIGSAPSGTKNKEYALEIEKDKDGHYDFPFENFLNEPVKIGLEAPAAIAPM